MNIIFIDIIVAVFLIAGFLIGIRLMQSPRTALFGNRLGALCMSLAMLYTMYRTDLLTDLMPWLYIAIGSILGLILGQRVKMIRMPQMVALLNGFGGAASALVAGVAIMLYTSEFSPLFRFTAALALAVGPLTFSGSMVAALKLQDWLRPQPVIITAHRKLMRILLILGLLLILICTFGTFFPFLFTGIVLLFTFYGVLMALRVGGADMPIIIALLNSFSGIAASVTGLAVNNALLTGVGALVGVAGLVLTRLMCQAMNRSLFSVLGGFSQAVTASKVEHRDEGDSAVPAVEAEEKKSSDRLVDSRISKILEASQRVIIVPGYGMAVSQAQQAVKQLVTVLKNHGKQIKIALNPLAGRMLGHMNVLLAEVGIDDEIVSYVETINPEFPETDLVIVVGACDIINPAVQAGQGPSIYGMPVLEVNKAKHVILCNRDNSPGYSGIKNTLYEHEHVIAYWGDASETVPRLSALLQNQLPDRYEEIAIPGDKEAMDPSGENQIAGLMEIAEKFIIVPGYGMAVAQAQMAVMELVTALENLGKQVKIAVHPVAGRMPGHMNVLLAEVGIDYEKLFDMNAINPEFPETDMVVVVGACDVINPAARTARDTPLFGMPVLEVERAKHVILCNRDSKPGYSGVENTLYNQQQAIAMWGDAAVTVPKLTAILHKQYAGS